MTYNAEFTGEVMPGSYPLPVKIETYAGSATYENLLTARITSEPLEVRYPFGFGGVWNTTWLSWVRRLR